MSLRSAHIVVSALASLALFAVASSASAAPPYVDRDITLPRHDWAFDLGLGVALATNAPSVGFNLEMGVGLTDRIELGVRTGLRPPNADSRGFARADEYGRLFDRETFDTGVTTGMANPEVRVRGALLRGGPAEVALEGRVALPIENGTRAGIEVGVPLAFHAGRSVRFDTGLYIPIGFYDPVGFHIPFFVWFQPTSRVWLGPLFGLRFSHPDADRYFVRAGRGDLEIGFGLGVSITRTIDFKTMFLVRRLAVPIFGNVDTSDVGVGAGLQFRIE
jgi:hypothetical protein